MNHDPTLGVPSDLAALYANGDMSDAERERFEQHFAHDCEECRSEVAQLLSVVAQLIRAVPPVTPHPETKAALFERIAASGARASTSSPLASHLNTGQDAPPFQTIRADSQPWEPTEVEGVSIQVLHIDRGQDQFTALVRMEPGSSYPKHVHGGPEHCFVIEGDLRVGDHVLHSGDYEIAAPGSHHGEQRSENGCLLLITSSMSDQFD